MSASAHTINEQARLTSLLDYSILDTPPEQLFDDFTTLAADICQTPISLICLLDDRRQWFKSKIGLSVNETPREISFCTHAINTPQEVMVVNNARQDERFKDNPLVTDDPNIHFYAGAPLVTSEGHALGTLCVIHQQAHSLSNDQIATLRILARQIVSQLEARKNVLLLQEAANKLERQRHETQLILDNVPAYVFYKDTHNRILRVNQAVAASLGRDLSEIEGRPTSEIYPNEADQYYQDDLEVIRTGQPKIGIVEQLEINQGEKLWISTDKIPIANELGEITSLLVVASDITKLKKTEASLRESQSLLQQTNEQLEERVEQQSAQISATQEVYEDLYQNAPDMFVSVDSETGTITECNHTFMQELGYSREELIGRHVTTVHHTTDIDNARNILDEFRNKGEVRNREMVLSRKDNSPIHVSLSISAIRDEHGHIVASRSVCRDITEKKRLEEELNDQNNQLAHLSRIATINEIATGIAHELNQPLHAIKNYAQGAILRLSQSSFDPTSLTPILDDIIRDADRAAELIHSLRRFVKPSGQKATQVAPTEILTRVQKLLSHEIEQYQITLTVIAPADLPKITCDDAQITQVLINLILNAAEASAESPEPVREIRLFVETVPKNMIRFSVVDRGHGASNVDHIFDAFYTTKTLGLGMGLAICRTIVEAHRGTLTAKPNEDQGLTVSFELPLDQD